VADRVADLATAYGVPPARIALAWLLHKPAVTAPIVGATKPRHVEDALAATDLALTADDIQHLEEPYVPHPVLGHS
jgi:1-deoxyxylulose-5-phosphate synthase